MALVEKAFGDIITFTRASGGGRINSLGQYEWVAANVPRLTHDPVTLQPLGLLIEEQRTNLLLHSENPTVAAWAKVSATIGANVAGPAGLPAQRLVEAAGAGLSPAISQFATVTSGATVVGMRFVKAGERSFARMQLASSGGTAYAGSRFNLADGAKVAGDSDVSLNSATNVKSGSVNYGSGWWLLWLSCTLPAGAGNASLTTRIVADASSFGYTGDGVSAIYIGPAQLEEAGAPGSYIPTTVSQVTRAADLCSVNTLSPWYNSLEGTLVVSAIADAPSPFRLNVASIDDGTAANRIQVRHTGTTAGSALAVSGGTIQAGELVSSAGSWPTGTPGKAAFSYKENSFAFSVGGGGVVFDNSGSVPPVTRLVIGGASAGAYALNGTISSITYYPSVIDVQQASA